MLTITNTRPLVFCVHDVRRGYLCRRKYRRSVSVKPTQHTDKGRCPPVHRPSLSTELLAVYPCKKRGSSLHVYRRAPGRHGRGHSDWVGSTRTKPPAWPNQRAQALRALLSFRLAVWTNIRGEISLRVPSSRPQCGSRDRKNSCEYSTSTREPKSLSFEELNCKHSLCKILEKEGRSPALSVPS